MRFVSLTSNKGGVGKTTAAINMVAAAALLTDKKVMLVEADPGARTISLLMRGYFRPEKGWIDYLKGEAVLEEVLVRSEVLDNLYMIFSSSTIAFKEVGDKEIVAEQVDLFKKLIKSSGEYALVVVDCPGKPSIDDLIYGTLTDLYLVTGPNISEVKATAEFRRVLNRKYYEIFRREVEVAKGVIVNFLTPSRSREDAEAIAAEVGLPVFAAIPASPKVSISEEKGKPLVLLDQRDPASRAFLSLALRVLSESDISHAKRLELERKIRGASPFGFGALRRIGRIAGKLLGRSGSSGSE
ncbi:hypothetical protein DRN43_06600 [Thermococci archaeon]|nr:MAG: hypothetical protein DRN43_06600 [Thermococci archaeon]